MPGPHSGGKQRENDIMGSQLLKTIAVGAVGAGLAALAACAPKPAPPPPPPPPAPVVVVIPPRPMPPLGASSGFFVPAVGTDGVRKTVNAHLSGAQSVWNLRSAYNVAALNCLSPEHAEILGGYKTFLKAHKKGLATANLTVDSEFRKKFGAAFIRPREVYMTQVYNYYAFPPTLKNFCDAALVVARESTVVKPAELSAFSVRSVATLDSVFETFFRSYEKYQADAAQWDTRYGARPAVQQGALVAPGPR